MSTLRKVADAQGHLFMPNGRAVRAYEAACEGFAADGDRPTLMRDLLRLGVPAAHVRWHLTKPGRRMICMY